MLQSATDAVHFPTCPRPLDASFDLDQLTADGGLLWLVEADDELGLSAALAAAIPEWRRGPVRHPLEMLVRQRVLQIACGYPDQNDATTLRHDPLFKLGCGRLPTSGRALASQPTLSRLDNTVDAASCAALERALARRRPAPGLIHHSDQGVQYASDAYVDRLQAADAKISMAAAGNPYENAKAERFFRTLKHEEVYLNQYDCFAHAEANLSHFIDDVYNAKRFHSSLGYLPPIEFEAAYAVSMREGDYR